MKRSHDETITQSLEGLPPHCSFASCEDQCRVLERLSEEDRRTLLYTTRGPRIHEITACLNSLDLKSPAYDHISGFMNHAFGLDDEFIASVVEEVKRLDLLRMSDDGLKATWTNFPRDPTSPEEIFPAFVQLSTAVTTVCCRLRGKPVGISWHDIRGDGNRPPPDSAPEATFRPEVVATIPNESSRSNDTDWWLSVLAPITVTHPQNPEKAVVDLLRHIRQVFQSQANRRFVYGILVAKTKIQVWLVDHSTPLMSSPFDIHENPAEFIQLVAGLTTSPDHILGWDTSMRLSSVQSLYPSKHIVWEVSMPGADRTDEEFILFHQTFMTVKGILFGRATRIWKAWRKSELTKPAYQRKVYIMKDTWTALTDIEGETVAKIGSCEGVGRVYSARTVINPDTGGYDTTHHPVRLCIVDEESSSSIDLSLYAHWRANHYSGYLRKTWLPVRRPLGYCWPSLPELRHYRLLLEDYGLPLTKFTNLLELVGAFQDLVAAPAPHRAIFIDLELAFRFRKDKRYPRYDGPLNGTDIYDSAEGSTDERVVDVSLDESPQGSAIPIFLSPIHELESIFWVLCHLTIERLGPCMYRGFPEEFMEMAKQLWEPEDSSEAGEIKLDILTDEGAFQSYILDCMAPYFEPVKPILAQLRSILYAGYKERSLNGFKDPQLVTALHIQFMDALAKGEAAIRAHGHPMDEEEPYRSQSDREVMRRHADWIYDPIDYQASGLKIESGEQDKGSLRDVTNNGVEASESGGKAKKVRIG
ncbi:hypothetical protein JAAARDRAFT_199553 [Jaapia argillacea MUCL 33604]|uniref:Fungal-type protein kinase domain-containing protein n=1 Tax=Jaapia argillacea MUCL 33604 TaxID=933084 RepID=A0A067P7G3_9AGAM|nr:hypothetical protein JAAARDRAFT_199553 [Jaapia argillacea MUCL 33604]